MRSTPSCRRSPPRAACQVSLYQHGPWTGSARRPPDDVVGVLASFGRQSTSPGCSTVRSEAPFSWRSDVMFVDAFREMRNQLSSVTTEYDWPAHDGVAG